MVVMKKLFIVFLAVVSFTFFGCNSVNYNDNGNLPPIQTEPIPPVQTLPTPPIQTPTLPDVEQEFIEPDEEENKKKLYAVANVNGLRVRSKPNTSSTALGTLDKNDAVLYYDKINGFYKTIYKEQTAYVWAEYCSTFEIEYEDERIEKAIDFGSTLLGYPYVWGSQRYHWGNGKLNTNFINGEFDCSALVQYVYYKTNGVILDLTSRAQSLNGVQVNRSDLKRGDLMFFTNASRKDKVGIERIGHVGIYFGNNYILHTASDHAVIEPISSTRWSYYVTARRVV